MGKHEVGTPKYIANKIKAKGLQKLRWYCQMCEKQCRDENGFKCHTTSESHQRQLLLFADNSHRYMDSFSRDFCDGFLNLLKRQFGTKRVPANKVYQDYIADRDHVHMNATNWLSLTAFVKYLGKTGKCVVDETEKGWFVTYIDRDPETLAAEEKKAKKQKLDKDDEERMMEFINKQIEAAKGSEEREESEPTPFFRAEEDAPVVLSMKMKPKIRPLLLPNNPIVSKSSKKIPDVKEEVIKKEDPDEGEKQSKKTKHKESKRKNGWLMEQLVVKIMTRKFGEKFYKAKGVVVETLENGFVGKLKLNSPEESESVIKVHQDNVETVIPGIGKEVIVLWGKYKLLLGTVKKVRIEEYCLDIEINGEVVKRIPYEQICKYGSS